MQMVSKEIITRLISEGRTEQAIQQLLSDTKHTNQSLYNKAILLNNRFNNLKDRQIRHIINHSDSILEASIINNNLIELINNTEENTSVKKKRYSFFLYLIGFLTITLAISLMYFDNNAMQIIKGQILVNNRTQKNVEIIFKDFEKSTYTNSKGEYSINLPKFESTKIQILFEPIDTTIQISSNWRVFKLEFQNEELQTDSLSATRNINQIIDSDRSVIQTEGNSSVTYH